MSWTLILRRWSRHGNVSRRQARRKGRVRRRPTWRRLVDGMAMSSGAVTRLRPFVLVADAPERDDAVRHTARPAELAPQAQDVGIDGAVVALVLVAPEPVEQVVARERPARVRGEQVEQIELLGR